MGAWNDAVVGQTHLCVCDMPVLCLGQAGSLGNMMIPLSAFFLLRVGPRCAQVDIPSRVLLLLLLFFFGDTLR